MANLNTALSPSPVVECETASGNTGTSFTGNVTVALGNNPTGATLGGTKAVAASAGFATFSTLTLDRSGKGFTLRATANNLKTTTSTAFDIATELKFTTQPVGTITNTALADIVVAVQDSAGNTDTNYDGVITLTKFIGPGNVSGTLAHAAVSGVATFSGLKINMDGTYAFRAEAEEIKTAYPPASVVSDDFVIGAFTYTVTSALTSTFVYGFAVSPPFAAQGSISPTQFPPSTGVPISQVINPNSPGSQSLIFSMTGTFPQNYFTSLTINGGSPYLTASASSLIHTSGQTQWVWAGAGNVIHSAGAYTLKVSP